MFVLTFLFLSSDICKSPAHYLRPSRFYLAIQGLVFGTVRDKRLYAAMMLLVGNEYASGVFPMLMLYHR